ncbi:MAG: hypothetical protein LBH20_07255 [Treponema sp.]|jgi:hypothetical protein|nr:hypothetical protein [Treponema sp.]
MKKIGLVVVIVLLAAGAVFAQRWGNAWGVSQSITIEGTLQLQNGQIAVSTENAVYFVPVLSQYVGFIDGLKEGSRVSVLGYAWGNVVQATQITINGKSYDFQASGYGNYGSGWCGGVCYGAGNFAAVRGGRGGGCGRRW